jgi:ligand-binding SRPBCC domain-containing protein
VKAAVEDVAEFHSRSASMAAITPPPMIVRVHSAPDRLKSGDRMDFTLWAGPLPIHWTACIEDVSGNGFTDRQLSGPFGSWVHRHGFERVDDHTTDVVDRIEASYRQDVFWGLVGRLMWAGMPLLFALRARRTRALLEFHER